METQGLKIMGKEVSEYALELTYPSHTQMVELLSTPPAYILSKELTFKTGVLGMVDHVVKTGFWLENGALFLGVYLGTSADDSLDILHDSTEITFFSNGSAMATFARKPLGGGVLPLETVENLEFNLYSFQDVFNWAYYIADGAKLKIVMRITHKPREPQIVLENEAHNGSLVVGSLPSFLKRGFPSAPFFLSDDLSDVNIQIGDMKIIPGHRIVLSGRSDYFKTMFSTEMRESLEGVVKFEEDPSHFLELLRFIYTGRVEKPEAHLEKLFVLSDKYQVPELSALCEAWLLRELKTKNAMKMYELSQSVGEKDGELAKNAKELVVKLKGNLPQDLEQFTEFFHKYPEILFEIVNIQ